MKTSPAARPAFPTYAVLLLANLVCFAAFTGCASTAGGRSAAPHEGTARIKDALAEAQRPAWEEKAPGIAYAALPETSCGAKLNVVRIELAAVRVCGSIPESVDPSGGVFTGEYAADLAEKTGAAVAVNMTPFAYSDAGYKAVGVYIHGGERFSPANGRYAAILFFPGGKAEIIASQDKIAEYEDIEFAFGGFWTVLEDGVVKDFTDIKDSRTVLGVSEDGSVLFILTAEKRSAFGESGLSFPESGALMKALGATHAIQMDGGSSTALVVNGEEITPASKIFFFKKNRKTAVNAAFIPR